eukprot:scaffold4781_cov102-Isochrysis_galbana.AAC.5
MTSSLCQGAMSMPKMAEVASQMVRPWRSSAIQSRLGTWEESVEGMGGLGTWEGSVEGMGGLGTWEGSVAWRVGRKGAGRGRGERCGE